MNERTEHAAAILDKWGHAIRGDWRSIDGRQCRTELDEISAYLRGKKETLTAADVGVCEYGGSPHWYGEGWGHNCYKVDGEGQ